MSPEVKIRAVGCDERDLEKALQAAAVGLRKKREEHDAHESFSEQNAATEHLVRFVNESYRLMVESLTTQIRKILEQG